MPKKKQQFPFFCPAIQEKVKVALSSSPTLQQASTLSIFKITHIHTRFFAIKVQTWMKTVCSNSYFLQLIILADVSSIFFFSVFFRTQDELLIFTARTRLFFPLIRWKGRRLRDVLRFHTLKNVQRIVGKRKRFFSSFLVIVFPNSRTTNTLKVASAAIKIA